MRRHAARPDARVQGTRRLVAAPATGGGTLIARLDPATGTVLGHAPPSSTPSARSTGPYQRT